MQTAVLQSNAYGVPFDLYAAWSAAQEAERRRLRTAAANAAAQTLRDRSSDTSGVPLVVRVATKQLGVSLTQLKESLAVDGEVLSAGDVVLLTAQTVAEENGPWVCAAQTASMPVRPPGFVPTVGGTFFVTSGQQSRTGGIGVPDAMIPGHVGRGLSALR